MITNLYLHIIYHMCFVALVCVERSNTKFMSILI